MRWTRIRLELARTDDFPKGSAARGYVLRLPLDAHGRIDEPEFRARPALSTFGRYWSNEPDRHGCLLHTSEGWILSYAPAETAAERILGLGEQAICAGSDLTLAASDGTRLPFLVKSLAPA